MIALNQTLSPPRESLPGLEEFLESFHADSCPDEVRENLRRYLADLLTERPKNSGNMGDAVSPVIPHANEQHLQELLTHATWDENDLNRQRVQHLAALPTQGDAVLIFDDTAFAKRGHSAVGTARQYCSSMGKIGNCQVVVNCHYAERTIAWPVAVRLYLPRKEWAENTERRRQAGVPEGVAFQTKAQIALELLDQARAWGLRHACVTAIADYGDNPRFLDGLESRGEPYVVAIRRDFGVTQARRADTPSLRAEVVMKALPVNQWQTFYWHEETRSWLRARFAAVRCWRVDGEGQQKIGWLIGQCSTQSPNRRSQNPQEDQWKYFWSNFGPQVPLELLVRYAHRRHWAQQYQTEAKALLPWGKYLGPDWKGFHRHATMVMLAFSFLIWLEWRGRGKPRQRGLRRRDSPSGQRELAIAGSVPSIQEQSVPQQGPAPACTEGCDPRVSFSADATTPY